MARITRKVIQSRSNSNHKDIKLIQKTQTSKCAPKYLSNNSSKYIDKRLQRDFFAQTSDILSQKLLGKVLCKREVEMPNCNIEQNSSIVLRARIVETEMYPGVSDPASHSYQGKKTSRNGAMFMDPGVCYVYNIYGMYQCLNISSLEPGGCVLLRALEPLEGLEKMKSRRLANKKKNCDKMKDKELCSGPSKLCQAFDIKKDEFNGIDLVASDDIWLENASDIPKNRIVPSKRIGIESAGTEVANKLYRFYELSNENVSVRDKSSEQSLLS